MEEQIKSRKVYWTIGEAAAELGESTSLVRFWANRFEKFIKPFRNNKGNRLFSKEDLEMLKRIHFYVKERGMKLDGVENILKGNREGGDNTTEVVERLGAVKKQLEEIMNELDR